MSCLGDFKTAPECYVVMTLQMMMMIIKREIQKGGEEK